ncbi:hypothetical protein SAOR_08770 [Salinisphaera orenii MK-B5]|uniref:MYND finger n=2 Tax=Salinisphaera orenii TaxID=856731 RepID=A0A423PNT0_9GAMM|nr:MULTISPECIES: PP0621 family protein [Salinisphaera]ROO27249.1 hypothetical protein SAOR_08770 [Salinisphaera orenii MK-B5]ROO37640.1 hypothetical protein SAHL_00350 [Salinisphaera halophila YIM 95161]
MARLLGLLLIIGIAWLAFRQLAGGARTRMHRREAPPEFERTVRCERCGVHLPLSLAERDGDDYVCSEHACRSRS